MRDDPWFSGFADGEASFNIAARKNPRYSNGVHYLPSCAIGLRADDAAVLEAIHQAFGGYLHQHPGRKGMQNPVVRWMCCRKDGLPTLVEYFDRFPLRSKKRNDYRIWREAVIIYCSTGYGHRFHSGQPEGLADLRLELMAVRKYRNA